MVINYRIAAAAIVIRDARDIAEAKARLRKGISREIIIRKYMIAREQFIKLFS